MCDVSSNICAKKTPIKYWKIIKPKETDDSTIHDHKLQTVYRKFHTESLYSPLFCDQARQKKPQPNREKHHRNLFNFSTNLIRNQIPFS